jgi:hypothetical protein
MAIGGELHHRITNPLSIITTRDDGHSFKFYSKL